MVLNVADIGARFEAACGLRDSGRLAEAESAFRAILTQAPHHSGALCGLAHTLWRSGDVAGALACFQQARSLNPSDLGPRIDAAACLRDLGRHAEAQAEFDAVLAQAPDNFWALCGLGHTLRQTANPARALACFERARELAPSDPGPAVDAAHCLRDLGRLAEAEAVFRAVLAQYPDSVWALCGLGHTLRQAGDAAGALACFTKAHDLNPADLGPRIDAAHCLRDLGRGADAETEFRALAEQAPDNAWALAGWGQCLRARGDAAAALKAFERAARADPAQVHAQVEAAECLRDLGRTEEAAQRLDAVIARHPGDRHARICKGQWLRATDPAASVAVFEGLVASDPCDVLAWVELARGYAALGDDGAVEKSLKQALAVDPNDEFALLACAEHALRRRDSLNALAFARRAIEAHPSRLSCVATLARTYLETGRPQDARATLDAAHVHIGDHPELLALQIVVAHRHGDLLEAARLIERASPEAWRYFPVRSSAITLALETDRLDDAATWLDQTSGTNNQENSQFETLKGQLAEAAPDAPAARKHYETALKLDQASPANYFLARLKIADLDFDEARALAKKWVEANRGEYNQRGTFFEAAKFFERVIAEFSSDVVLNNRLQAILSGPQDERLDLLREAVRTHPDSLCASVNLIRVMRETHLPTTRHNRLSCSDPGEKIPSVIFQFWDQTPPDDVSALMRTWADMNPDFAYIAFDLDSAGEFIERHCAADVSRAFRKTKQPSQKADLFRLAYLKINGGVYVDADERCLSALRSWLPTRAQFVTFFDQYSSLLMSPLAAIPEHPVIAHALAKSAEAVLAGVNDHAWLNGPGQLTRAFAYVAASGAAGMKMVQRSLIVEEHVRGRMVASSGVLKYKVSNKHWMTFEANDRVEPPQA